MKTMPNNLNKMIELSGLQKKVVAERKGVTPETLSRHIHERVPMTIQDARDYAEILDCTTNEIIFEAVSQPIIGTCHILDDKNIRRKLNSEKLIKALESGVAYNGSFNCVDHVFSHTYLPYAAGIMQWTVGKKYMGQWAYWGKALEYVMLEPIVEQYVSEETFGKIAFCWLKNPWITDDGEQRHLVTGVLYPEPGGVYQIVNHGMNWHLKEQELVFAAPSIGVTYRPTLRGMTIGKKKVA